MTHIPYGRQWIDETDIESVDKALCNDWITQGPVIETFEQQVAGYVGAKYGVAFNSGTSALHGAMHAAGIGAGDEVITTPITFVATPNSVVYQRGLPVFVDIDMKTYCIDTNAIEDAVTGKTKGIAPVDMAGYPVDIRAINDIAHSHDCVVIEDAAHALGAVRNGQHVGKNADMTVFSFHPVKHITTGEGGMVVTDNEEYYEILKRFRTHGITKDPALLSHNDGPWYYEMQDLGFNYRITDIQCALGLSQLKKLNGFLQRRKEIASRYDKAFSSIDKIIIPPVPNDSTSSHAYHLYPVLLKGIDRKKVFSSLMEKGIYTQVHYIPVHTQPFYSKTYGYSTGDYPHAEYYYQHELSLPMYPGMSDDEVGYVIDSLIQCISGR